MFVFLVKKEKNLKIKVFDNDYHLQLILGILIP